MGGVTVADPHDAGRRAAADRERAVLGGAAAALRRQPLGPRDAAVGLLHRGDRARPRAGRQQLSFTGLEDPPLLEAHVPGRTVQLQANRIGSISLGSPVFFRDLQCRPGARLGAREDGGERDDPCLHPRALRSVRPRQLRASGTPPAFPLQLGAEGVQLQLESLTALLLGGIAFDTPEDSRAWRPSATVPTTFTLYPSEQAAKDQTYRRQVKALAYFQGSVSGLRPGAPVTFQGLRVGQVTSVELEYDPARRHDPRARAVRDAARAHRRCAAGREARPAGECADAGGEGAAGAAAERQPAHRPDAGCAGDGRQTRRRRSCGSRATCWCCQPCRGRSPAPWPR